MDIFFADPDQIPLPPEEVRILSLEAKPYADDRRVLLQIEMTPFQKKPNLEIKILNSDEEEVAELSIVEALEAKMDFTMHLREPQPKGGYTVRARVFLADIDRYAEEQKEREKPSSKEVLKQVDQTLDEKETRFRINPK